MTRSARALLISIAACRPDVPVAVPGAPGELVPAIDLDPDPDVVEVALRAEVAAVDLDGIVSEAWGYRDLGGTGEVTVPGPLIDVPAGARLRVRLENALPESTTLHFHGVRLPNAMDGTDLTQGLVRPGETFTYDFVVSDAALYWYHPHFETPSQVWKGLYGAARGTGDSPAGRDRVFVLSDLTVDAEGRRVLDVPLDQRRDGRQGERVRVNGAPAGGTIALARSERWQIVNACTARFFTLATTGRPLTIIGTDAGAVAVPYERDALRLAPGDRVELFVSLPAGATTELLALPTDRAGRVPAGETVTLWTATRTALDGLPPVIATAAGALPVSSGTPGLPVRSVRLGQGVAPNGDPIFSVDGVPWPFETPYEEALGATAIWDVRNDTDYDQAFHLHGFFFRVLEVDGVAPAHATLEDTAEIPRHASARLLISFDAAGAWMFHTHVLDQAELGMMSHVEVR